MTELLKKAYDPEEFRSAGYKLVDAIADHLSSCLSKEEELVLPWQDPETHYQYWENELKVQNLSDDEFWKETIKNTIHIHHPNYFGHQVCATVPMSGLGDLINGTLNNGSAIYEMGPVSTAMEHAVIKWLCKAMGFPDQADGFLTSGGSLGNFTALLAARQAKSGYDHWKNGKKDGHSPAIMVSEEAHYSVSRSVQMLGWGENAVIKIPTDSHHRVNADLLSSIYEQKTNEGMQIIALVGNSCTTSTGSYDPLESMADFCDEKGIWFHVDGAHGGAAALSKKYSHLTAGISRADSLVVDFHKMMGVSALTTAVIFKDPLPSYETFEQKAKYILSQSKDQEWYNSAKRTIECTKNMMGIKVYAILKIHGPQFFVDYLETCYDLGHSFAEIIQSHANFELGHAPDTNIVVFRYCHHPDHSRDLNALNKEIRKRIVREGRFYIVQTEIEGITFLRTVIMNPFTTIVEMQNLLDYIEELSKQIQNE
jgi:L-2,4-diaminobutyrate decarboxylase